MATLAAGDEAPELRTEPITRTQIVRYAGAGGDFNPIHFDDAYAQRSGMAGVFGHGLLAAGIVSRLAHRWLGLGNVRAFGVRFTGQFFPGDVLTCSGRVVEVREAGPDRLADCELWLRRDNGDEVVRATATARIA
jgi:acyl dehydratase